MIEKTLKNAEMGRKKIKLKQITFKYLQASKYPNNYKVPYIPLQLFFTTKTMAYTQAFADFALKQEDKLIGKLAKMYGFDAEEAKERLSPKTEEQRSEEERLRKEKQEEKVEKIQAAKAELTQLGFQGEMPAKIGEIKKEISKIKKAAKEQAKAEKEQAKAEKEQAKAEKEQAMQEKIEEAKAALTKLGFQGEMPAKIGEIKKEISNIKKAAKEQAKQDKLQKIEAAKAELMQFGFQGEMPAKIGEIKKEISKMKKAAKELAKQQQQELPKQEESSEE